MRMTKRILALAVCLAAALAGWSGFGQVEERPKGKAAARKKAAEQAEAAAQPKAEKGAAGKKEAAGKKGAAEEAGGKASQAKAGEKGSKKGATAAPAMAADEQAIRDGAAAFVKAYNEHDAQAIAQLFALRAEFTDEDGNLIRGREAIAQDFAEFFKQYPQCQIEVRVDSVRLLTPNIAIEEGTVHGRPVPDEPQNISSYVAVHVKVEGQWLIGSVSDFEAQPQALTPHEHLLELEWMVGDWLDENPEGVVKTRCRWDASGNYLLHEVEVHIAGVAQASGSLRIGWDPLAKQIKSWGFEAGGGYSEGLWSNIDDEWMVKVKGVTDAGEVLTATHVFRFIDAATMTWRSYDRVVGGEVQPDVPEYIIKRHPPEPGT